MYLYFILIICLLFVTLIEQYFVKQKLQYKCVLVNRKKDILQYSKQRNPFCHPSVIFKKSKVLQSGNYLDMKLCEDYYLWIRMLQNGCVMDNCSQALLEMRVTEDLYARRGGYKYFKSQKQLFKYMKKTKFIGLFTYLKILFTRFAVQVLMPNKLRQKFYEKKLRKNK